MKARALVLLLLLLGAGGTFWLWRRTEGERRTSLAERTALLERLSGSRKSLERQRGVEALWERAAVRIPKETVDVALLRDRLIAAEQGLGLDRFSIDFRPAQSLPSGAGGSHIQATLGGTFRGIYQYLSRVEALPLVLVPEEISLQSESGRAVVLTVRWNAFWSLGAGAGSSFSDADLRRLSQWLERKPPESFSRDPFVREEAPGTAYVEAPDEVEVRERERDEPPSPVPPDPVVVTPELRGFILARPELEADVSRRVLAALRFEGELRIVKEGDSLGAFRIERIEPRESVLLVNEQSGERITLYLP